MGRVARLDAAVMGGDGANLVLLPFVNGRRWGAHERPDAGGRATFLLPLPNPGPAEIQVVALPSDTGEWWGLADHDLLMVGHRLPDRGVRSNRVRLEVVWRDIAPRTSPDPDRDLFCMQWEPWFTTGARHWRSTQAIPLTGLYDSYNPDVTRLHMLWMMDLGVDFIMPDWSNHIWGCEHWDERGDGVNMILHATELALETLAVMRDEGLPVPKVALMPGLSNGPPATMAALDEELAWIYHTYLRNPRFDGLWQLYDGKPLVLVLDTAALAHPEGTAEAAFRIPFFKQTLGMSEAALDAFRAQQLAEDAQGDGFDRDAHFTVRWMSSQNQATRHHELGHWSWMDGVIEPPVTYKDGVAEAVTVTPSFFNAQGWTGPLAHGRRGGATYLETFKVALEHRPRVIFLHQFNEFTGQPEGHGYGPDHTIYVDTYNVEFSDDLEPVSLTAPGYRGDGGWGFTYLNLTRALVDVYRHGFDGSTLLAVSEPLAHTEGAGEVLPVAWSVLGPQPESFTLLVDDDVVAKDLKGSRAELPLTGLAPGAHTLTVIAEGAVTRYPLSYTSLDEPLQEPVPVRVDVPFWKREA